MDCTESFQITELLDYGCPTLYGLLLMNECLKSLLSTEPVVIMAESFLYCCVT